LLIYISGYDKIYSKFEKVSRILLNPDISSIFMAFKTIFNMFFINIVLNTLAFRNIFSNYFICFVLRY